MRVSLVAAPARKKSWRSGAPSLSAGQNMRWPMTRRLADMPRRDPLD
jgi:hypothetical protein